MYEFLNEYSYQESQEFSKSIFKDLRSNYDDIYICLEDVCKALETVKYVKYIGKTIEEYEHKINFLNKPKYLSLKKSRLNLVVFKFKLTLNNEQEIVEMPILVPKKIDKYFYFLNGNKYYPVFQIVDESTYNTKDSVILKSLLMPIYLKCEKVKATTLDGSEIEKYIYITNLFNRKLNSLYYYLAKFGYDETLKLLNVEDFKIVKTDNAVNTKRLYFPLNKQYCLSVSKSKYKKSKYYRSITFMFLNVFCNKRNIIKNRKDITFWIKKLGSFFTTNNNVEEKGLNILSSFERLLDERTKRVLRIKDEYKSDIYALTKWEIKNFNRLKNKDNLSLDNKRIRLSEYLIAPILRKLSVNTYRMLNSRGGLTFKRLETLFKISPFMLIKKQNELVRYDNQVNDMDFNIALKFSCRGPQALGEGGKKNVPDECRDFHESHVGCYSLNTCSTSDPGLTGCFTPFMETDGFYFSTKHEEEK